MARKNWLRQTAPKWVVDLHDKVYYAYIKAFPKRYADFLYHEKTGKHIDWKNPQDLNEKGRWIQFNTDTSQWSKLADKYRVREYIEQKGHSELLVDLYGVWKDPEEIDFSKLPQSFVLKTNHGSGEVILIQDKTKIDYEAVRTKIGNYLKESYGVWTAEPHYLEIEPCIIAEQLLPNTNPLSSSLAEYKVYCHFGKPILCGIPYDRDPQTKHCLESWYSPEWEALDDYHSGEYICRHFPKPSSLEQIYEACKDLASQFPLVRMDFYEVNGKPYFGEMTFTPEGFYVGDFSDKALKELGQAIDLTRIPKEMLKK